MTDAARPLVSMLVLAYQQAATIEAAVRGALAQAYSPLEIVISDDASTDATWAAIERAVAGYGGPHRLVLNRNPGNLGIGAHLNRMVGLSHGELLFVAAGDDISLPQRCARVVDAWLAAGRRPDLISSALVDLDESGHAHDAITPTDLSTYRDAADWIARPPHVIGAAQAWTRRVFDRFGPLPAGTVAEDLLMVFRAIVSGGAITLAEPLVQYRRGGISRRRRNLHARDVVERLLKNNRHALVELPQLLADARRAGQLEAVEDALSLQFEREVFVRDVFGATTLAQRWRAFVAARRVPLALRARLLVYAACPAVMAPFFVLKRVAKRHG
ncbi:glycosyltransferase [Rhizobacter sp. Root404]|uniref:glycosyltransferase family 2 protein n=1 Tax=Rhizobacter sp. Root404 TaxID=1736528 RepID=UPI000AEEA119|nr:glycosyltransferase [Rhizobacter sp. Root404]